MTPANITAEIADFLSEISQDEPVYVPVKPDPTAQVNECFVNVLKLVEREGGSMLTGWQIWQTDHLIEAEFHGIWRSVSGELVDITPKSAKGIAQILFLPDTNITYHQQNVDNIRHNRWENPLVSDLILVSELYFKILNKGNRVNMRQVNLSHAENQKLMALGTIKNGLLAMLNKAETIQSSCFCLGQLKYKKCHAKELVKYSKSA